MKALLIVEVSGATENSLSTRCVADSDGLPKVSGARESTALCLGGIIE